MRLRSFVFLGFGLLLGLLLLPSRRREGRRGEPARAALPADAARPAPPRPVDPRRVAAYEDAARALEALVARGRSEAMAFGEIAVDVPERGPEARDLGAKWRQWADEWEGALRAVRLPGPSRDDDEPTRAARDALGGAQRELQLLLVDGSDFDVPMKSYRQMRLDDADHLVTSARKQIQSIGRERGGNFLKHSPVQAE